MIHLINVEKYYDTDVGRRVILNKTNLSIPTHRRVGLLGRNGAGKTTLLRLISGVERPNRGKIVRKGNMSWPLGLGGGLHPELTGLENIRFITKLYDADLSTVIQFVEEFSEIGEYLKMPLRLYSQGMRSRLMFGLSLAIDFDCYLIDELVGVGDRFFREKSKKAFTDRADRSGLLIVSHNEKTVKDYCEHALVLYEGILVPFDDVDDGIAFYLKNCELR
ncbi:MAG: ABC transporter ATP-binding protein [Sneathiella sp.]|nr:ABC transporter ATP-binding protein [Sneathiella sp.]